MNKPERRLLTRGTRIVAINLIIPRDSTWWHRTNWVLYYTIIPSSQAIETTSLYGIRIPKSIS